MDAPAVAGLLPADAPVEEDPMDEDEEALEDVAVPPGAAGVPADEESELPDDAAAGTELEVERESVR